MYVKHFDLARPLTHSCTHLLSCLFYLTCLCMFEQTQLFCNSFSVCVLHVCDLSVCADLFRKIFARYRCVFINVVYWNAVAPGVLIHTSLFECVCVCGFVAVRLLISTTPNSVYSYRESVKSQK